MTVRGCSPARLGLAGLVAATTLGFGFSASAAETTYQRLLNASAEPQNWLMRMGNYNNWNNSSLAQINRGNVANLKVKFMFSLGDPRRPN
jgi:glucose dehydrogenase